MDIVATLTAACPDLKLLTWDELGSGSDLLHRLTQSCYLGEYPSAIAYPQTQDELANVARVAHDHGWRILPFGNGSKLHWGGLVRGVDLAISTAGLDRVVEFAEGDLTLTVEAGVTLSAINALIERKGQQLAVDPTLPQQATIGGVVATADTGSLRQRYGGIRDRLIGVQFVRHDGAIAKAGGRVVKNVAGYDLMKLLTGSYGTLGIITQLTFRLYPIPSASQTLMIHGQPDNIDRLARAIAASSLTPTAFDLVSPSLMKAMYLGTGIGLALRFQTVTESITEQSDRVIQLAQQCGAIATVYSAEEATEYWMQSRARVDQSPQPNACSIKFGTRSTAVIEAILTADRLFKANAAAIMHYQSGLGRAMIRQDQGGSRIAKWRQFCDDNGGFLSVLGAPIALKQAAIDRTFDLWGYRGNAQSIMNDLADQFDPDRRYSPGRYLV
ncbi:MAG: FAD-binding oxidoreductase [Coleofasciculaceae cyanobacterium RL_1_1]|nr:FAD-binding oxidoreductase [Coleofasciculaceae cyanobacterium RL_1_1]